jgi:hypothetical protein
MVVKIGAAFNFTLLEIYNNFHMVLKKPITILTVVIYKKNCCIFIKNLDFTRSKCFMNRNLHIFRKSFETKSVPILKDTLINDSKKILFVCLFSRVPEGRMTVVSSRSHASCQVWARTHRGAGSHKATRHADGVCFLIPSSRCDQHRANSSASQSFVWFTRL